MLSGELLKLISVFMGKIRAKEHKRIDIICTQSLQNLRTQLKEGTLKRTQRDLQLAKDWYNMERMDTALKISLGLVEI